MSNKIKIVGIIIVAIMLLTSCNFVENNVHFQTSQPNNSTELSNKTISENGEKTYVNETQGYQITFPDSWSDWYIVDDEKPSYIEINFLGKSVSGSTEYKEYTGLGLPMFYIVSEKDLEGETLDSIQYLGNAKGIKYYYATLTCSSLGPLHEATNSKDVNKLELELVKSDLEKINEMKDSMVDVAKTFKAIN